MSHLNDELAEAHQRIVDRGHNIGKVAAHPDGRPLIEIDGVFMFEDDMLDLAHGLATIEQIRLRNDGLVFPAAGNQTGPLPTP